MMLWTVFALMSGGALFAVLWPLLRGSVAPGKNDNDMAVYRDQLDEIERDRAAGIIGANEAEAARVEVSRRLLAADAAANARTHGTAKNPVLGRRLSAALALVMLTFGVGGLYLALGSPDLPGQPLAARVAEAHGDANSVEALFAQVEAHLEQHPEDGRGWEVIAPVYMRLGRYDDAAKARANALRLLGPTAQREADLGEALVALENGVVTADAKAAFDAAIRLDGRDVTARFYQGIAAEQDGSLEDAARIWRALLADAPEQAQWAATVRQALARVESTGAADAAASRTGGSNSSAEPGQDQMIRGMVERLAARLHEDGSDVDGWIRLARSYKVLGEPESLRTAIADARRALASESDKLRRLDEGIRALDAESSVAANGPTPSDATKAAAATPGQDQMIRGMVERLAARLHQDGSDVDGWIRLARSYKALGEPESARAAVAAARRALASEPDKLRRLDEGIQALGAESAVAASAPSPSDTTKAAAATPGQDQMIRGMVERLAARLRQDGSDVDGWVRLVRSYMVLGDSEKAHAALTDARRALQTDPDKLRRLDDGAKSLGIDG
ncbi:MAG: c-type cytochrome biogenesis protein CcmI [Xanthobacteraceae bacterium]